MRLLNQTALLAVLLAAGACRSSSSGSKGMTPPDLGPGYAWAGGAIPTGDVKTSVLTIEKIIPSDLQRGQNYAYTIRVANITKSTKLDNVVVVDDTKSSGFEIVLSEPAAKQVGTNLVWNLGAMAPGAAPPS